MFKRDYLIAWLILIRDITNKFKIAPKLHDGGRRAKGKGSGRGKNALPQTSTWNQEIVTRQVKTCLHLPTLGSYHTIYLSDFPTRKTERSHALLSTYLLTSTKKWLLEWGQFNFLCSCFFKILKTFSRWRFSSILRLFMLSWIKVVCINIKTVRSLFYLKTIAAFLLGLRIFFLKLNIKFAKTRITVDVTGIQKVYQ